MSPYIYQPLNNNYSDDDDEMPDLESDEMSEIENDIDYYHGGQLDRSYELSITYNEFYLRNSIQRGQNFNHDLNPAEDEEDNQNYTDDEMPELVSDDQNIDSFIENIEVNDSVLDFGDNMFIFNRND